VLQGIGMACVFIPLSTIALSSIEKRRMSEATGVYNLVRQLGGSFGVAIFASLLGRFATTARHGIIRNLPANDPMVWQRLQMLTQGFMSRGADMTTARARALQVLEMQVGGQSAMISFEHAFALGAMLFFAIVPLVFLLRAPEKAPDSGEMHPVEI